MGRKVLVTGCAGFIGSHIVDALITHGHQVRVLDMLEPQVHGEACKRPVYLHPEVELICGDVLNDGDLKRAIDGVEIIFHDAAAVGVGQSMYQIAKYVQINTLGTAKLMDFLVNKKNKVQKVIIAASMSSYGEGTYECKSCGVVYPKLRSEAQMQKPDWEVHCPLCDAYVSPIPTSEEKPQQANSIYALTKREQEEIALMVGRTYRIPVVALRYFNVYGPRQSLSNPYTGVTAIFMSRIKNGNPPVIYEDGLQTRDFISVHDIVKANILAMEHCEGDYQAFNVGSGKPITIVEVARILAQLYVRFAQPQTGAGFDTSLRSYSTQVAGFRREDIQPEITNNFRKGDVRHCYADISKIKQLLGFQPQVNFEEGVKELVEWAEGVEAEDRFELATKELKEKGLC